MENWLNNNDLKNPVTIDHKILSMAIEAAGIGSWDWNIKGNDVFYDETWLNMLGYSSDENVVYPTFWEDRIHPEDKSDVLRNLQNHLENKIPSYKTEHRLLTKNGTYIWVLDTGKVIEWDENNNPKRLSGITINITEKVLGRNIQAQTEDKYRSIFNHLNDGFCRFNLNGNIIEVNKILCELIGTKKNDILNSNIKLFFKNLTVKYLYRQLTKLLAEQSLSFETTIITSKKKELPVHISARLITQSGEGIIQALVRDITIQKQYETKIIEEKNKLNALIEHSHNVIARFGKNLKCLYLSQNSIPVLGINPDIVIGKRLESSNLPSPIISFLEHKFKQTIKKGKETNFNFSFESSNGIKYFEAYCVPEEMHGASNPESIIVTFSDTTEKITREKQLLFSKQSLEQAEKNVHFGSFEYNFITKEVIWSKETYQIYEHDTNLPAPGFEEYMEKFVLPEDKQKAIALLNFENNDKLVGFNNVYRIITSSGKLKFINSVGKIEIDDASKQFIKISGTIKDLTEIKQIEDKLFLEKDIIQLVIDNIPDSLYIKDIQGDFIRCNKHMADFFGFRNIDNLIGKTIYDIFPIEDADEFIELEQNLINKGENSATLQKEIKLKGRSVWINHTIISIKDTDSSISKIIGIISDITEYITAQQVIIEAKEKAEKADMLKSAFLANMSHEIRTPINGILGFASLMEMKEFSREKEIEYLRIINNSGKLLLNLINDIIDIAKIEAGQLNMNYSNISLKELFDELSVFYQGEKNRRLKDMVNIEISLPDSDQYNIIYTDQLRLKQIINNLFSNAIKFTSNGKIEIGYQPIESNLLFFVKDTGSGIDKNECNIIFERFKQANNTTDKKEGTGLGLAISKGLIELLGGKIWVESERGEGSSFYFTLPFKLIQLNKNKYTASPEILPMSFSHWENKTILLVEDEEINYLYIKELIDSTGITLLHASSAEEAIQICKSSIPIHLVLMDMRLPGLNGFQATPIIKQIRKDIPIIAQTAYAMENERKDCIEAGCDHYITKPFDQDLLFEIINDILIKSSQKDFITA